MSKLKGKAKEGEKAVAVQEIEPEIDLGNEKFNERAGDIKYARERIFRRIVEKSLEDDASNKSRRKSRKKSREKSEVTADDRGMDHETVPVSRSSRVPVFLFFIFIYN